MPATAGLRGKRKVHYLVPPTPVALVFWNHRVAGNLVVGYSISAQLGIFALVLHSAGLISKSSRIRTLGR
jgi:hypothetical protein